MCGSHVLDLLDEIPHGKIGSLFLIHQINFSLGFLRMTLIMLFNQAFALVGAGPKNAVRAPVKATRPDVTRLIGVEGR